jgi:hypothetical protein
MGQWLIADLSVADVHFQVLDVVGVGYPSGLVLWATRSVR